MYLTRFFCHIRFLCIFVFLHRVRFYVFFMFFYLGSNSSLSCYFLFFIFFLSFYFLFFTPCFYFDIFVISLTSFYSCVFQTIPKNLKKLPNLVFSKLFPNENLLILSKNSRKRPLESASCNIQTFQIFQNIRWRRYMCHFGRLVDQPYKCIFRKLRSNSSQILHSDRYLFL